MYIVKMLVRVLALAGMMGVAVGSPLVSYEFGAGSAAPVVNAEKLSAGDARWVGVQGGVSRSQQNLYVPTSLTKGRFDSGRYLSIEFEADRGSVLNPQTFSFELGGSRNSPGAEFSVSAVVRSDVDGYAENLPLTPGSGAVVSHTFKGTSPTFTEYTADLSGPEYQGVRSLSFRIFICSSSGSRQINLRFDNIRMNGQVVPGTVGSKPPAVLSSEAMTLSLNQPELKLTVAPLFTENAVLQRNAPLSVWGTSKPGETVTVRFAGQTGSAQTDESGHWEAELAPLAAEKTGRDFIVESVSGKIVLSDVVVGEVWLCSGQSNMEWPLKHDPHADSLLAESAFPLIRQFKVKNNSQEQPSSDVEGLWVLCAPDTAGAFTAVGYYFARELQAALDVPIGIINASWGGTKIEPWMSRRALLNFPDVAAKWNRTLEELPQKLVAYEEARAEYKRKAAEAKATGAEFNWRKYPKPPPGPGTKQAPSGLFNGMISPLIPYCVAGILWYQGESNCGNAAGYARMQVAYIQDLRTRWGKENMPFYFVQLPNYEWDYDRSGTKWATFRAAQMQALSLPDVGAAIVIDGMMPKEGHPPDKSYVGVRLARLAAIRHYRIASGDASGPLCRFAVEKDGAVELRFAEASSGLTVVGNTLTGFEVAGDDGVFHPAAAQIKAGVVVVSSNEVRKPASVRYAWKNNPVASLYNGDGLPASPFSMDVQ